MDLTGRPEGPPLPCPARFVERLRAIGGSLGAGTAELGRRVEVDVLALLGERAALAGLRRGGDVSCGGSARLLRTADGWLAVNLPRPDDLELLPAWLAGTEFPSGPFPGTPGVSPLSADHKGSPERITHRKCGQSAPAPGAETSPDPDVWAAVAAAVAGGAAEGLVERAQLLGLPVAAIPCSPVAIPTGTGPLAGLPVVGTRVKGPGQAVGPGEHLDDLLVVDLSSLWAGPLCTHLLQQAGARVVKVESVHRPDGARLGPPAFFDLLHGGQEAVAFDFQAADGRAALRRLIESAHVVVEASRPRALEQLGIVAETVLATAGRAGANPAGGGRVGAGPRAWVSITGYGRGAPGRDRVAFGDDVAVAGGLVAWDEAGPCFLADAVADPCAGLVAAAAVLRALASGGRWLLDVSMRDVAAHLAGPGGPHPERPSPEGPGPSGADRTAPGRAEPARARAVSGRGPSIGEHTEAVLAEVGAR